MEEIKEQSDSTLLSSSDQIQDVDIQIKLEISTFLSDNFQLAGFYFLLRYYHSVGILNQIPQKELRDLMKTSTQTFTDYKDALIKLGLITEKRIGKTKRLFFNPVKRFAEFEVPAEKRKEYIEKKRKEIILVSPQYIRDQIALQEAHKAQLDIENKVQEKLKKEKEKAKEKAKREEIRFKNEDYELVLNAYKRFKGIGLVGPEINRAKKAIKQMFLAGRSVKQIVDCMKFFSEHSGDEDYKWMQYWTVETVMKKIPEFVAGKLKAKTTEDVYERY